MSLDLNSRKLVVVGMMSWNSLESWRKLGTPQRSIEQGLIDSSLSDNEIRKKKGPANETMRKHWWIDIVQFANRA